ncbi:MAG: thioredoxin family protein [Candidatus Cloacimonadaceae bacterium]|jgi:thioredoxin-related protein|nr:thioredoxin family protein [Candidatus Cloacimonadota bacterium]MDX9949176.1 thioredoxin family protein [Candidatus Syntrophosphaera sp.]NLN85276.1 thioredoxin family protein [Candidatus Cloacimonadota bacterium]
MKPTLLLILLLAFSVVGCTAKEAKPADNSDSSPTLNIEKKDEIAEKPQAEEPVYEHGSWITDYKAALEYAKELKRPILANFTGSDWCVWCYRIRDEIFTQDAFKAYARENLVLLTLDFPRGKKLPAEEVAQNQRLMNQFGVQGFPTILLIDANGKEIARTGYRDGGAAAYVKHLKDLLAK